MKRFWKLMNCFCYFCQKKLGVTHNDHFFVKIGPKNAIFKSFTKSFSELLDCNTCYWHYFNPLTYFIRNQPKNVKCVCGPWGKIWAKLGPMLWKIGWGIHLKVRSSGYRISDWKLKAKLARNTIFEGY